MSDETGRDSAPDGEAQPAMIPPVEVLEKYEAVIPGSGQRCFDLLEEHARHLMQQQERKLESDIEDRKDNRLERKRGQACGLIIGIIAIISGSITACLGHEISGGFIGTGGVIGLVAVFVMGRSR